MAQRRDDESPRQFGGSGIRTAAVTAFALAATGNNNAALGAGGDIEVIHIAPGLADNLQFRQAFDNLAGDGHALLREHEGLAAPRLFHHARGVRTGVVVDDDFVVLQPGVGLCLAKDIRVIV